MQFLYRIQPTRSEMLSEGPTAAEADVIQRHFSYLQRLMMAGAVQMAGRTLNTDDSSFGIVIFEAESEEAASEIVQNDPAVQKGVMHAELFPFRTALLLENWALE